jgi:hypothetical protein
VRLFGGGLGSLRRNLGLLGLIGVACVGAAHASAAPAPALFRLTIVGTAHQEWSHSAAPVESGGCTRTETSDGIRAVSFHTGSPVIVQLSGGRVLPVNVRGIIGTVTLGGSNTTEEVCGDVGNGRTADCAQTRRAFRSATVHAASPRPGVVTVDRIANVRLALADCPREPTDVRLRPLGPSLNLLRLPRQALMEQRLVRINLRASRSRRTVYGPPQAGRLVESAEWTLTFVRVGS